MVSVALARTTSTPSRCASETGKGRSTCSRHQGLKSRPGSPTSADRRSSPGVLERRYTPAAWPSAALIASSEVSISDAVGRPGVS